MGRNIAGILAHSLSVAGCDFIPAACVVVGAEQIPKTGTVARRSGAERSPPSHDVLDEGRRDISFPVSPELECRALGPIERTIIATIGVLEPTADQAACGACVPQTRERLSLLELEFRSHLCGLKLLSEVTEI